MADALLLSELECARGEINELRLQIAQMKGPSLFDKAFDKLSGEATTDRRVGIERTISYLEKFQAFLAIPTEYANSFSGIEEQIKQLNNDFPVALHSYEEFNQPISRAISEKLGLPVTSKSDIFYSLILATAREEMEAREVAAALHGVALYKAVFESHVLQDKRDSFVEEYLNGASGGISCS